MPLPWPQRRRHRIGGARAHLMHISGSWSRSLEKYLCLYCLLRVTCLYPRACFRLGMGLLCPTSTTALLRVLQQAGLSPTSTFESSPNNSALRQRLWLQGLIALPWHKQRGRRNRSQGGSGNCLKRSATLCCSGNASAPWPQALPGSAWPAEGCGTVASSGAAMLCPT